MRQNGEATSSQKMQQKDRRLSQLTDYRIV